MEGYVRLPAAWQTPGGCRRLLPGTLIKGNNG
jgi:hypothetical protein